MGEAKRRGSLEQRSAESQFYESERKRLDEWLRDNRPAESKTVRVIKTPAAKRGKLIAAISLLGAIKWGTK